MSLEDAVMDWKALSEKVRAVHIFAITPFKASEGMPVDLEGMRRNAAYWGSLEGKRVVAVCCGTGEHRSLSVEENRQVAEAAAEGIDGRCPLLVGIGGETEQAVRMTKAAKEAGADVVLVMPEESVHERGEEGLYRHHAAVAEAAEIGVMPFRAGKILFSVETMVRLMEIPNVVSLKDETGQFDWLREMILATSGQLPAITGGEMLAPYAYLAGASGITTGVACLLFHHSHEQWKAAMEGDFKHALAVRDRLAEITRFRGKTGGTFIKAGLELMGLAGGPVRANGAVMGEEDRSELRRLLVGLGAEVV
jgi:dihydrodipicolinate synthase/N-acetylneuraminate lyase